MRSNYKRLGKYIQEVNVKNSDLAVETLLGVSIQKILIPSIANTIGSDMSKYKIVEKNQFAYGPVTSRNGDKISVALLKEYDKAIISQSYKVFEVIDEDELLPDYLMMWFSRPEFDRYARFMSHGSTRETFDWDEMCEVELPIPPIEEQRAIVAEYQTVTDRIQLNEQINAKLEETAQALYRHWFVDFEFPISAEYAASIGRPDLNGKPYKSSGGKMVWNEELEKEVPEGWEVKALGDLIFSYSKTHSFSKEKLIFFNTSDILKGSFLHSDYMDVSDMPGQAKKVIAQNDILYSEIRPKNRRYALVRIEADDYVVSTKLMVLRRLDKTIPIYRFYHLLTEDKFIEVLQQTAEGRSGTFPQITFEGDLEYKMILFADSRIENIWNEYLKEHYSKWYSNLDENKRLQKLKTLLLSKMASNKLTQKASAI